MGEGKNFLDFTVRSGMTNEYGESHMHVMKECLFSFRVAFAAQKDSPYRDIIGRKIQQLKVSFSSELVSGG